MAKNIDLKVRIKGAAKAKKGLGGVDNSLKSLGKSAMAAGAAFFGARAIIGGIKSVVALEREQTLAVKKLETALGKNVDALLKQASALQQVTTFGDETIIQAQAMLAMFIKDEEQLKKATIATLDLAAAKGMDLVTAADLVGKSVGSSTNALARYGVSAEGAAGSTERLNSIVDGMTKFFGGQARAIVDTMAGSIDQMNNAIGDVGEDIGELLAPAITKAADAVKEIAESINLKTMQDFARSVTGIAIAFAAYSSAALLAKVRTIQFQATLIKTGWGALIVGAGLAIGKMMELAGVFSTTEGTIAGLNDEMKELGERTFLLLDPSEQKEKILETKNELLSMFEEGSMGASAFQSFLKNVATKINSLGLTASESEAIYTAAVKAGVAVRKDAREEEIEQLIMSEEQKASIKSEFNQRFLEMTVGQNELQNIELQNATERFREAGIEEVEIAKFVAERKKAIDVAYKNSKISSVGSLVGAFGQLNQASKGSALVSKRLAQGEAVMSTWVAVNKALAAGVPPWNIVQATAIGAMGLANVLKIEQQEFAQGGDFVTSGPQSILVGDNPGGRERVSVEPLSSPNINGPKGGITLNISAPLVDETVIDHIIPAIEKAQRNNLA